LATTLEPTQFLLEDCLVPKTSSNQAQLDPCLVKIVKLSNLPLEACLVPNQQLKQGDYLVSNRKLLSLQAGCLETHSSSRNQQVEVCSEAKHLEDSLEIKLRLNQQAVVSLGNNSRRLEEVCLANHLRLLQQLEADSSAITLLNQRLAEDYLVLRLNKQEVFLVRSQLRLHPCLELKLLLNNLHNR
jgi:hypothetical protein